MVWVHLRKERFPQLRKNKLMPRAAGPFPIIAKFGGNAYKVELLAEYNITNTFNIGDLQLYKEDQELSLILPQEGGVEPCIPYSNHGSSQVIFNLIQLRIKGIAQPILSIRHKSVRRTRIEQARPKQQPRRSTITHQSTQAALRTTKLLMDHILTTRPPCTLA